MNDSFVVSVPNVMQRHEDVTTVPWGRQSTVIYQVEKGFGSYAVVYAEYPREFIEAVDLQKLFDAPQANIVPVRPKPVATSSAISNTLYFWVNSRTPRR